MHVAVLQVLVKRLTLGDDADLLIVGVGSIQLRVNGLLIVLIVLIEVRHIGLWSFQTITLGYV